MEQENLRYTFAYTVISTGKEEQISVLADSKEQAAKLALETAYDYEFTTEDDIQMGDLLSISKAVGDNYIECAGCAS
ncbi:MULTISPECIES: hypothetical protein [Paenibacillus]|uniref:hypothetical protein n=1 Tax=Paenibacillus TaxID=44249 RepID=UPI00083909C7|nr:MULTISPECIES: hypothetical protein [Paenibacillus]GIP23817.1 hypothetical protein J22TS3_40920 [Paenibacillus sp. J22TS3]